MKITVEELGVKSNLCRWKTVKDFLMILHDSSDQALSNKKNRAFYHACDLSYLTVKFHIFQKNRLYFRRPLYVHKYVTVYFSVIPLLFASLFPIPFCSPFISLYLLGTLLAVTGSSPPRSQVARKLISPFASPHPYTPHSKIPTPWGFPELNIHITKTTSRTWLTRSSTVRLAQVNTCWDSDSTVSHLSI